MNIVIILVPLALAIALFFLISFIWATRKGQFDDLVTPAHRILMDDKKSIKLESQTLTNNKGQNS